MAYQPKSYKKFVATAATATLVATAVVPAAFANEAETAAFTDVPKSYEAAIDFVVANNISKGLTETKYGIDAQIKRGDVAIIIANAAGLNNKDAQASGFKDVPTRGTLAVNSLKAAGIVDGKSTTNFGFADSITRGEAAIMLQRAFKLTGDVKDVKFTDVSDRYDDAVAALLANKVTKGVSTTKFGTDDPIKRGDFAKFIYALKEKVVVVNPEAPVLKYTGESTINVAYGANFTLPTVTATDNKDTNVAVTSVITNSAGNTVSAIDTKVPGTYKVTYSAVDSDGNKANDVVVTVVVAEGVDAAVTSVSAINAQTVEVKFTTALDKDTFDTAGNFTVAGTGVTTAGVSTPVAVTDATLSADGKTVTLSVAPNLFVNDNQYTVTVDSELQTAAGTDFAKVDYVTNFLFSDTVAPSVSAVSTPNGLVRIAFTETLGAPAVGSEVVVVINGQSITLSDATQIDGNVITLTKAQVDSLNLTSGTNYSIAIAGAEDLVGNEMNLYSSNFTYRTITDTTPATVTAVTAVSEDSVNVKFSEEISEDVAAPTFVVKRNGVTLQGVTADSQDGVNYVVDLSGVNREALYVDGETTAPLTITISGARDLGNNVMTSVTKTVTLTEDNARPTLSSTSYNSTSKLAVLKFNEDIVASGSLTSGVTVINTATSQVVTTAAASVNAANDTIEISGLSAGSYSVRVDANYVKDVSFNENSNAAFTTTVNVSAEAADAVTVTGATSPVKDRLVVTFSDAVTGGTAATSAANPANYRLDGQALPAGTLITLDADSEVATIQLPTGSIASTRTAILTVSNVKADNGTTVATSSSLVNVLDSKAPTLTSAKVVGTELELTLSENVTDATFLDNNDFIVKVNGVTVAETVATGTTENDNKLVVTTTDASFATGTITVEVDANANGTDFNAVSPNTIVTGTVVTATR